MIASLAAHPLWVYPLVAVAAFVASSIAGVTGYGTSLLMPLVLVPIVGPEPVVPIVAITGFFTNGSRIAAFRDAIDGRTTAIVLIAALPTCLIGAWTYTRLGSTGVLVAIGAMLVIGIPLRRVLRRMQWRLRGPALIVAAGVWGLINGGTPGAGVILVSMLLAAGLEGAMVIATDAAISVVLDAARVAVFGIAGVIDATVLIFALLAGACAIPGAFVARAIVKRLPLHLHTGILDAVVLVGGLAMIASALR